MTAEHPLSTQEQFEKTAPNVGYFSRISRILGLHYSLKALDTLGRLPGLGALRRMADRPRLMPLSSEASWMARWYKKEYGSPDKPLSIREIPWKYIEEHQEEIPFFGLRNYWYPALKSDELRNNENQAVELLGDNIVLFRDADGNPCALENRCPHRGALLTMGQTNVWDVGTLTCRYHGATFNGKGECVAFLGDGPDSPVCNSAKMQAKAYPAQEQAGVIWLWMGDGDPEDICNNLPQAENVLADGYRICFRKEVPYSYLNQLDNTTDMTHVGCLHRTCLLFGDQKMGGGVSFKDLGDGIRAMLSQPGGHAGKHAIDDICWYLPNLVFHGREFMDGNVNGLWFWFVPRNAGHFAAWMIGSVDKSRVSRRKAGSIQGMLRRALESDTLPGLACFVGGDAPMQMSQGRVVRWDKENLTRTDRAVVRVRQILANAHKAEIEARRKKGLDGLVHRVQRPADADQIIRTPGS